VEESSANFFNGYDRWEKESLVQVNHADAVAQPANAAWLRPACSVGKPRKHGQHKRIRLLHQSNPAQGVERRSGMGKVYTGQRWE